MEERRRGIRVSEFPDIKEVGHGAVTDSIRNTVSDIVTAL